MKKQCKISILTLVLVSIFLLSIVNTQNYSTQQGNDERSVETRDPNNLESPKKSGVYLESFIHIEGNWSIAEVKDWCYGDGSWGNPYIIENVTIDASSSPTGSGIIINNSKTEYFIIRNCNITNAGSLVYDAGIKLENTNNGTITNNNCSNNDRIGIYLVNSCENNTISGNNALNNNIRGICLENYCDNNTISGNNASNDDTSKQNNGIYIRNGCDNNTITGNTANNNTDNGIILFQECDNNALTGNNVNNNDYRGIYLDDDCDKNTISGNSANNNTHYGIHIVSNCDNNTISGNTANNNTRYGIYIVSNCDDNIISENIIKNNTQLGIKLDGGCDNNLLYYNAFIDNGIHANDDGTNNEWDNLEVGNYWDNYTAPDSNNNGIVDDPYTWITGSANSEDNFPLTEIPIHLGEKIHIDDTGVSAWNWSKTARLKAWCDGSGTYFDPYVIGGLEIDGGGSGNCILIENSSVHFIIRKCMIRNAGGTIDDAGIKLENTNNGTLINNSCLDNGYNGILLYNNCDNNNITGNTASNTITSRQNRGIFLRLNCDNNTISGNTANDNTQYGIYLSNSYRAELSGNQINECGVGISGSFAQMSSHTIYTNNTVNGRTLYYYVNENGLNALNFTGSGQVILISCNNSVLSNLNVSHTSIGIFLYRSNNNIISGNTANDNTQYGIYLNNGCDDNTISGNTANDNTQYGIYLSNGCDNNNITGSTANDNTQYGIYLSNGCDNNNITGSTANKNGWGGIYLKNGCNNNTISGNIANDNGDFGDFGICLYNCDNNNITGNTANENGDYGIWLVFDCDNNIISGNTANENGEYGMYMGNGIYLETFCDNNIISGNTANDNTQYGICLYDICNDNTISGNTANNNTMYGIYLEYQCDRNKISENYIFFNIPGAIRIFDPNCDDNIIEKNVLVSEDEYFILCYEGNTLIGVNLYLTSAPSPCVEVIAQSFSTTEFSIVLNISSSFNIISDWVIDFTIESIQMWWNGTIVAANKIVELGFGSYNISLDPILVNPGEDPILLNMTISTAHYGDKYFELNLAVDKTNLQPPAGADSEITIITPESKTYTEPMSGYYPGIYGFENEVVGTSGDSIDFIDVDNSDPECNVEIYQEYSGHKKVLKGNQIYGHNIILYHNFTDKTSGTIEWWQNSENTTTFVCLNFFSGNDRAIRVAESAGSFSAWDASSWQNTGESALNYTWYHLRVDFECANGNYEGLSPDTYYFWVDNTRYGPYAFDNGIDSLNNFGIVTGGVYELSFYMDAFGFSWEDNYDVGDNLNEGLLLSYENSTVLEWMGYSLDGQANKTILGNTTLPFPDVGFHRIQVFGNDSLGNIYQSNIRYFTRVWDLTGSPIIIDGDATGVGAHNWTWVEQQVWFGGGDGSQGAPYIIEYITFNGQGSINIRDSNKYFIIRNCMIFSIKLKNTNNGNLTNNNCSNNGEYGIFLEDCYNNNIIGNIANENGQVGINIWLDCGSNTISGNIANENGEYGIYLTDSEDNIISGNTVNENGDYGILLNVKCHRNNISENYIYLNPDGAIRILPPMVNYENFDNIIEKNVLVSEDEKFIYDGGVSTLIGRQLYLTSAPSLCVEVIVQSFSTTQFSIILNISSCFNIHSEYDFNFIIESIQMWWDGTIVAANKIVELGFGSYKISLDPIFVNPGKDPILINMTISATHHGDKYFELKLAVGPKSVAPIPSTSEGGGDGDDDKAEEINVLVIFLITIGIASAIGIAGVAIFLIKKHAKLREET